MIKRTRTFKDAAVLQKMLFLRQQGWPLKELAIIFDCDKTSVRKACLRNGLPAELPLFPYPIIIFKHVIIDYNGERLNAGKNYKEYLLEKKRRSQLKPIPRRSSI